MASIFSYLFGNSSEQKDAKQAASALKPAIIDPRRIDMVKSHTIIGSIEPVSHNSKMLQLVSWLKDSEAAIAKTLLEDGDHLPSHALALRPYCVGGSIAYGPGCFGTTKPGDPVYVLGDTHGDFETLVSVLDTVLDAARVRGSSNPTVYLLGDILDRNTDMCAVESAFIMAVMQKALPDQFAEYNSINFGIVKGDHDVALSYREPYSPAARFTAGVKPADYCDWLNARLDKNGGREDLTLIGRAWIRLMEECPAAAFLDRSGTLLSHGGIPRSDLQEMMANGVPYIMQTEEAAQDFAWCRMVDAKNKLLNRSSKTSEIGFGEFESFNALMGGRIKKFIFGHQHPAKGFARFDKCYQGYDVICLSSFRNDTAVGGPTVPYFCRVDDNEINVYSMTPAKYVIKLEESTAVVPAAAPAAPAAKPAAATANK